jgi:hypothetical protein
MYDIITTALVFFLLVPGVIVSLPPGGSALIVAAVHALVFYAVLRYVSAFVPWWAIWIAGAAIIVKTLTAPTISSPF